MIITGLAGSGKTVALRALEDAGFYCVDNLPLTLMEPFTAIIPPDNRSRKVAVGIDIREKEFLPALDPVLTALRQRYNLEIIFLEADRDALIRRYKETRRPHPLAGPGVDLEQAIGIEQEMLSPLRSEAYRIIDTSTYTPHQLRHLIASLYQPPVGDAALAVTLISFGFKYGIPQSVDLLFDVRFLPNPYFVPGLRDLTGADEPVREFVFSTQAASEFSDRVAGLLNFLIPRYIEEGKAYLSIGFGCTGGRHRSPAIISRIAELIMDHPVGISIVHRDIA